MYFVSEGQLIVSQAQKCLESPSGRPVGYGSTQSAHRFAEGSAGLLSWPLRAKARPRAEDRCPRACSKTNWATEWNFRGLKGHESIAQASAWFIIYNETALKGWRNRVTKLRNPKDASLPFGWGQAKPITPASEALLIGGAMFAG